MNHFAAGNLASSPRTGPNPRSGEALLIQPIKETRIAQEIADRILMLNLGGSFPQGPTAALPVERDTTNG